MIESMEKNAIKRQKTPQKETELAGELKENKATNQTKWQNKDLAN